MKTIINRINEIKGTITVPSSKSITHRMLILAAIASKTIIKFYQASDNNALSKDILDTLNVIQKIGAKVSINNGTIEIIGLFNQIENKQEKINLEIQESATTLRLIIPLLYILCKEFKIKVAQSLFNRPMDVYSKLFMQNNICFEKQNNEYSFFGKGDLTLPKIIEIEGNISSQFISGLLIALPLLKEEHVIIVRDIESIYYLELTVHALKTFGIIIEVNNNIFTIKGNQKYTSPKDITIEGDYTQASNMAILALLHEKNEVRLKGLTQKSLQGDKKIILGLPYVYFNDDNELVIYRDGDLPEFTFDLKDNPDLAPILSVLLLKTGGRLKNLHRLIYKESNRLENIITEFLKLGIKVIKENDDLIIPKSLSIKGGVELFCHNDHRLFMAFCVLGTITEKPITINDQNNCISKSYPNFILDMKALNCEIK